MKHDLAAAMRTAQGFLRASDPMAATRTIQDALSGASPRAPGLMDRLTRVPGGHAAAPVTPATPGGRIETRHHTGPAGDRDYRLHVPAGPLTGVVVMLHGCTQDPDDFARGTRMDAAAAAHGLIVAYPRQTGAHNAQSCWNWFRPEDQSRTGGEPEIIAGITRDILRDFDLPSRAACVAGLSAGGAMAAILSETWPDLFAAAGIHSGLPTGAARDVVSAFGAMRGRGHDGEGDTPQVPRIVFHGTADHTVAVSNAAALMPGSGVETDHDLNGRDVTRLATDDGSELWLVTGAGHAWFGGDPAGSYADPLGPDASAEMIRFFAIHLAAAT